MNEKVVDRKPRGDNKQSNHHLYGLPHHGHDAQEEREDQVDDREANPHLLRRRRRWRRKREKIRKRFIALLYLFLSSHIHSFTHSTDYLSHLFIPCLIPQSTYHSIPLPLKLPLPYKHEFTLKFTFPLPFETLIYLPLTQFRTWLSFFFSPHIHESLNI